MLHQADWRQTLQVNAETLKTIHYSLIYIWKYCAGCTFIRIVHSVKQRRTTGPNLSSPLYSFNSSRFNWIQHHLLHGSQPFVQLNCLECIFAEQTGHNCSLLNAIITHWLQNCEWRIFNEGVHCVWLHDVINYIEKSHKLCPSHTTHRRWGIWMSHRNTSALSRFSKQSFFPCAGAWMRTHGVTAWW